MSEHEPTTDLTPEGGEYLGDGVYLHHDGYHLWLSVGSHTNPVVALDPSVFARLCERGMERMRQMYPNYPHPEL